ncbi:hypothetical protein [Mesorhizobium sp. Root102]|nr:hypothetical protein [Mesorhizobium sp. Root102]
MAGGSRAACQRRWFRAFVGGANELGVASLAMIVSGCCNCSKGATQ